MIYAVEILDKKWVKIGFTESKELSKRIAELQTGNPYEMKEIFSVKGTLRQEQSLHAALSVAFGRIRIPIPPNEWYPGKSPFFTQFLEYLHYDFDLAHTFAERYNPSVKQPGSKTRIKDNGTIKSTSIEPSYKWPNK